MNDYDRPYSAQCGTPIPQYSAPANPRTEAILAMTPDQLRDVLAWIADAAPETFDHARFAVL